VLNFSSRAASTTVILPITAFSITFTRFNSSAVNSITFPARQG
jgi:hypothetical protein